MRVFTICLSIMFDLLLWRKKKKIHYSMFGFVCYKVIQVLCMFLTFFEVCMTLRKLNFFSQMLFISLLSNIWLVFLHRDEL